MTEYIGGVKTLILEDNDELAERYDRALLNFPSASNVRVKTDKEAIDLLESDFSIQQVAIAGRVFTPIQALVMLRNSLEKKEALRQEIEKESSSGGDEDEANNIPF